jgi:hypothetical protein
MSRVKVPPVGPQLTVWLGALDTCFVVQLRLEVVACPLGVQSNYVRNNAEVYSRVYLNLEALERE